MERINVVILATETEEKVALKNKIQGEDISIVGYADFVEDNKLKIEGYYPDILIVGLSSDKIDEEHLTFIRAVQFDNSSCAVVLVTDKVTINLVNLAAKLGIKQVFDMSVEPEEFSNALREVDQLQQQLMGQLKIEKKVRAKVITYYGTKGGVGTTTVAVNTAAELASRGKKVILLDFDLQYGDDNLFLDIDPKDTIVELARDPEGINIERINATVAMHTSGFSVLCAPKVPEYADYVDAEHITKIIEHVRPYFEYILIDVGTNYADTTLAAVESSDEVQLIANLNVSCLKGVKATMNILDTLRVAGRTKLVITKARNTLVKVREFENLMQRKCYAQLIADRSICLAAMNSGTPYVIGSPRSSVSKDTKKYVDKLIEDKEMDQ